MKIELELWHLILLLMAFFGALAGGGKLLLVQTLRHLDERSALQEKSRIAEHKQVSDRLDRIETVNREEAANWLRIERDLMSLRADLPLNYVRREDYIRGQSILEAKIDGLGSKLEIAQLRALHASASA